MRKYEKDGLIIWSDRSELSVDEIAVPVADGIELRAPCCARLVGRATVFLHRDDFSKIVVVIRTTGRRQPSFEGDGLAWEYGDHHGQVWVAVFRRGARGTLTTYNRRTPVMYEVAVGEDGSLQQVYKPANRLQI